MAAPNARLVLFAAGINARRTGHDAAIAAGYAKSTATGGVDRLLEQARAAGLILTIEEATAPLEAIRAVVKPEDWRDVAIKALADAKAGDRAARQWLSEYLIGKPAQPVEHSGPNGGPIETTELTPAEAIEIMRQRRADLAAAKGKTGA